MTLRLNGSTSGYSEIDAPAIAGNNTIVLPSSNGAANQLLKNGATAGTLEFASNVIVDSSDRLLIGTTAVNNPQGGAVQLALEKTSGSIHAAAYSASLANTQSVQIRTDSADRAGVIGVIKHSGITNPCGFLQATAEDGSSSYLWPDNSDQLRISSTITHIGTTSGTVVGTQTSDERIKNILGPVTYGLDEIKQLDPVSYALKSDPEQVPHLGFIAQQVHPIIPESVFDTDEVIKEGEPTKLGMEYVALIPVLVNAIKELSIQNEALESRLTALEAI
jgi:hypothetical protein